MATSNVILTKEQKIIKEKKRLRGIYMQLDKNMMKTVEQLIDTAAFMAVTLHELEEIINRDGYVTEYQNGENQRGVKRSAEVDIHLAMTKNFSQVMRQLAELTPPAPKKKTKLQALKGE